MHAVSEQINLAGFLSEKVMEQAIVKAVRMSVIPEEEFLGHC